MTSPGPEPTETRGRSLPRVSGRAWPTVLKLAVLAVVNAFALASLPTMIGQRWWPGIITVVLVTVLIDFAYLSRWAIPMKYLIPATIFAIAFQVIPVLYSGYIAFSNFSTSHRLTQEQVVSQLSNRTSNLPGARYQLKILGADGGDGELAFFVTAENGETSLGTAAGLEPVGPDEVVESDGKIESVGDFTALTIRQINDRQNEILQEFEVPTDDGVIRAATITSAAVYQELYLYDEETETLTNTETETRYQPAEGQFTSSTGEVLSPGWQVFIGFDNFTRVLTSSAIRGPFIRVFIWNYVFALMSVFLTFVVGLALALALNHPGMRGRKVYRSLLLIPYALPSFMTALIWAGMFNQEYGIINEMLGADIPWLRDPTLAKVAVLMVNLWLGFPYMFLISTGTLQAIPQELREAAYVDGANPRQTFRRVTLPLLLVALTPLLIASFAFNFNNFNIIYLLNKGGPPIVGAQTPAGHTDILISYTYRLAFEGGRGADWGFASAIAIIIFVMVAGISAISFKRTRALEELA